MDDRDNFSRLDSLNHSFYSFNSPDGSPRRERSRKSSVASEASEVTVSIFDDLSNFGGGGRLQTPFLKNNGDNNGESSVAFSILFGVILFACIIGTTTFIILSPRSSKEYSPYVIEVNCDTSSTEIGNGICNDELNTRFCQFDLGDCCLSTNESLSQCQDCICWQDYNPLKKNKTRSTTGQRLAHPWEICIKTISEDEEDYYSDMSDSIQCSPKAIVFHTSSGKLYAYKSAQFSDGTFGIVRSNTELFKLNKELFFSKMAFVPDSGEIYLSGGIELVSNPWTISGTSFEKVEQCTSIRFPVNDSINEVTTKPLPNTWGLDSHISEYLQGYVYVIGGYTHDSAYDSSSDVTDTCGYSRDYKYATHTRDFYRLESNSRNTSAEWSWRFLTFGLALGCSVTIDDRYIYWIGGFHYQNRQYNGVHVLDSIHTSWMKKEERLPDPLFAHACNVVTLPDHRKVILTAGGFRREGIPAPHMFALDIDKPDHGWFVYGPSVPIVQSTSLVYVGKSLVLTGSCYWNVLTQCCDRDNHLFNIFDWHTKTWSDDHISVPTSGELAGAGAVEISEYHLDFLDIKWTSLVWPQCIQQSVDYVSDTGNSTIINVARVKNCANECQATMECHFWVFDSSSKNCSLKNSPDFQSVQGSTDLKSGVKNVCFQQL